jgi:hypothetical protein
MFGSGSDHCSIPDPDPGSRIRGVKHRIPDPTSFFTNFVYLSRLPDPDPTIAPSRIPDPGSGGKKNTGSRIRIRNTDWLLRIDPVPGSVSFWYQRSGSTEFFCTDMDYDLPVLYLRKLIFSPFHTVQVLAVPVTKKEIFSLCTAALYGHFRYTQLKPASIVR